MIVILFKNSRDFEVNEKRPCNFIFIKLHKMYVELSVKLNGKLQVVIVTGARITNNSTKHDISLLKLRG